MNLPIPPLLQGRHDYPEWKRGIEFVLQGHGLQQYISNDAASVPFGIRDLNGTTAEKDAMACALIYNTCSPTIQKSLHTGTTTASGLWQELRLRYAPLSEQRRRGLLHDWANLTLKNLDSALDFICDFNMTWDSLKDDLHGPSEEAAYYFFLGKVSHLLPEFARFHIDRQKNIDTGEKRSVEWLGARLKENVKTTSAGHLPTVMSYTLG